MGQTVRAIGSAGSLAEGRISDAQRARFERYLAEILGALGLDLAQGDTRATPRRLLDAWIDATCGYAEDPKLVTLFPVEERDSDCDAQIVEGPIPFTSLCEHHVLPFSASRGSATSRATG